ncbi:hypothetical protein DF043_10145 [Burkholderia cepacia]|nr:hypothetical protein DF043_10145 [Burkholderia cepacia]
MTRRRTAGLPVCRFAGLPTCRSADLPICRPADLPICRFADLPICRFADSADSAGFAGPPPRCAPGRIHAAPV